MNWMTMVKTLPCLMCYVFQSNWNSHFGACLWSFWCWKRVLKSRTSTCKVLQVFKSVFLEEQKMDPAESSGSFLMKHLKRNSQTRSFSSPKISFGSVKIHDFVNQISEGKFHRFFTLVKSTILWIQPSPYWASRRWSDQGKCSHGDHLWQPTKGRQTPQGRLDFRMLFRKIVWKPWLLWKSTVKNYLQLRSGGAMRFCWRQTDQLSV